VTTRRQLILLADAVARSFYFAIHRPVHEVIECWPERMFTEQRSACQGKVLPGKLRVGWMS